MIFAIPIFLAAGVTLLLLPELQDLPSKSTTLDHSRMSSNKSFKRIFGGVVIIIIILGGVQSSELYYLTTIEPLHDILLAIPLKRRRFEGIGLVGSISCLKASDLTRRGSLNVVQEMVGSPTSSKKSFLVTLMKCTVRFFMQESKRCITS